MDRGHFFAIGVAVIWGLIYAIDGKILTKIAPGHLIFVHSFLVALLTAPFFLCTDGIKAIRSLDHATQLLTGATVLLAIVANMGILIAIQRLGPSMASSFEISYPFFVILFSMFLFGERLSIPVVIGGVFICIGSLIIIRYG
ncbi:DMT family transporter [Candidatus Peregrinibacteria bacterium]|nr:DMT family transporter [Candidatus Peregrinibacteria bacterium]